MSDVGANDCWLGHRFYDFLKSNKGQGAFGAASRADFYGIMFFSEAIVYSGGCEWKR